MSSANCPSDLTMGAPCPCLRLEVARFPAKAPGLIARIAGCRLCGRSVAINLSAAPPCPYMAHPSVAGRVPVTMMGSGTLDF